MKYSLPALILIAAISPLKEVSAGHDTPLYQAACEFREAVKDFERGVHRSDCFSHYDERIVDRLEDATSRLRSAARHPDRFDRLLYEWNEVQSLMPRVQAAIFDPARYPPHPQLAVCWERVTCAGERFAEQLRCLTAPVSVGPPHYRHPHHAVPPVVAPRPHRSHHFPGEASYHDYRYGYPADISSPEVRFPGSHHGGHGHYSRHGNAISIPPTRVAPSPFGPPPRTVEPTRRDIGRAVIGALLTRILD